MTRNEYLSIVDESLGRALAEAGYFKVENYDDQYRESIHFESDFVGVRLERYHYEIYATVYRTGDRENQVNLFNLLEFLNVDFERFIYSSDPVNEHGGIDKYARKQLLNIAKAVHENQSRIRDFFKDERYASNIADVRQFMINNYPQLFVRNE